MQRRLFLASTGAISLTGNTLRSKPLTGPLAAWAAAATAQADPRIAAMGWAVLAPNPHTASPGCCSWMEPMPRRCSATSTAACRRPTPSTGRS